MVRSESAEVDNSPAAQRAKMCSRQQLLQTDNFYIGFPNCLGRLTAAIIESVGVGNPPVLKSKAMSQVYLSPTTTNLALPYPTMSTGQCIECIDVWVLGSASSW
eukprot:scaffold150897_cov18-Prasinocladus_malaysianus.AAC.1